MWNDSHQQRSEGALLIASSDKDHNHQAPKPQQWNNRSQSVDGAAAALCDLASSGSMGGSMDDDKNEDEKIMMGADDNQDGSKIFPHNDDCGGGGGDTVGEKEGGIFRANHRRNTWKTEEDELLASLVKKHGGKHWETVAASMPGRTAKQCHQR